MAVAYQSNVRWSGSPSKSGGGGGGGGPHRRDTGGPPGRGSTAPSRAAVESAQRANRAARERQKEREKQEQQKGKGIDAIVKDKLSQAKDKTMGGTPTGDPSAQTKKSWEAAGMAPTGQHKLRSQFDRLTAKYGAGFADTSQGRQLRDYLSGVPVERGGTLGARDAAYGGGSFATKSGNINKNLEAQRQALIKRISSIGTPFGGDMSTMLADIKREGIGADLTPDQFFNFTQQLMAADPSLGNVDYKAARPFSSGNLLQGIAENIGPGSWIGKGIGALTRPAREAVRPFTTELRKAGSGLRDEFGKLIPGGFKKDVKALGRDARTAAGGIADWFKFNPPAEYMGMTADPNFLRAMQGRPITPSVRPDGDTGGMIDAAQSVVNQAEHPWGAWIGSDPNEIRTADFIDSDRDGVDDRYQTGPGTPHQGLPSGDLQMPGFEVGQIMPHPITLPQAPFSGQTDLAASQAAGYDIPIGGGQNPNFEDWYKNLGIMQNVYS